MSRTHNDGTAEIVSGETFAHPPAVGLCKFWPLSYFNPRGYSIHRQTKHPQAEQHHGERLLKSVREGERLAILPWELIPIGPWWWALTEETLCTNDAWRTLMPTAVFDPLPKNTPGITAALDDGLLPEK